jgi:hypothetical protein
VIPSNAEKRRSDAMSLSPRSMLRSAITSGASRRASHRSSATGVNGFETAGTGGTISKNDRNRSLGLARVFSLSKDAGQQTSVPPPLQLDRGPLSARMRRRFAGQEWLKLPLSSQSGPASRSVEHREVLTLNSNRPSELPLPATYIIDRNGIIVLSCGDPDYSTRLELPRSPWH